MLAACNSDVMIVFEATRNAEFQSEVLSLFERARANLNDPPLIRHLCEKISKKLGEYVNGDRNQEASAAPDSGIKILIESLNAIDAETIGAKRLDAMREKARLHFGFAV